MRPGPAPNFLTVSTSTFYGELLEGKLQKHPVRSPSSMNFFKSGSEGPLYILVEGIGEGWAGPLEGNRRGRLGRTHRQILRGGAEGGEVEEGGGRGLRGVELVRHRLSSPLDQLGQS